ncbi:MAG: GNAT family N-acetyltransferase [Ktedonobacteraceae bacterium]|nr:GNAT family N-acetyltransferase [Ktedonobacteraceae bacterium]
MFALNDVVLRPLAVDDMESFYSWMSDIEFCLWGGWTPVIETPLSRDAFRPVFEQQFVQMKGDQVMFGIELGQRLVGFVQLARIDQRMRRAALGIGIGEKSLRGQGIGKTAVCLLLDYAFTVKGLERIYAEVFSFNQHSQKLMERVGFQSEGRLRQHDVHRGVRQDIYIFGILKSEFYQRYETIFTLESSAN